MGTSERRAAFFSATTLETFESASPAGARRSTRAIARAPPSGPSARDLARPSSAGGAARRRAALLKSETPLWRLRSPGRQHRPALRPAGRADACDTTVFRLAIAVTLEGDHRHAGGGGGFVGGTGLAHHHLRRVPATGTDLEPSRARDHADGFCTQSKTGCAIVRKLVEGPPSPVLARNPQRKRYQHPASSAIETTAPRCGRCSQRARRTTSSKKTCIGIWALPAAGEKSEHRREAPFRGGIGSRIILVVEKIDDHIAPARVRRQTLLAQPLRGGFVAHEGCSSARAAHAARKKSHNGATRTLLAVPT